MYICFFFQLYLLWQISHKSSYDPICLLELPHSHLILPLISEGRPRWGNSNIGQRNHNLIYIHVDSNMAMAVCNNTVLGFGSQIFYQSYIWRRSAYQGVISALDPLRLWIALSSTFVATKKVGEASLFSGGSDDDLFSSKPKSHADVDVEPEPASQQV